MAIPKHDEIRIPALMLLADKGQLKLSEFEAPLATHFKLSQIFH
jgi:restriction system protein